MPGTHRAHCCALGAQVPGASLGLLLLRVTGPFEKLRKALHLWPGEPHTARLPPLPSVGPNRRLSFLVHFPSLCCGGGKAEAVMPLVSHFMQRGYRAGSLEPSSQREIRLGLVHSAAPSCTGLSSHAAEGRVWVQKEFSSRSFQNEGVPTQKRELFSGW